jgi:TrmH family RNA methyltransferase
VYEIEPAVFKTIQSTDTSQGLIALVRPVRFTLEDVVSAGNPLIVLLARLQDPGNAGAILRIAESFGATGCLATKGVAGEFNSKTLRASAGSAFRTPHVWNLDLTLTRSALKESGIGIVGTSPSASDTIEHWDWRRPSAVMIGNEGSGLSNEELQLCDSVLRIPHSSSVESLNSAISAAIILYEASKQRRTSR